MGSRSPLSATPNSHRDAGGPIVALIASVGSVCILTFYCFYKVMTLPPREAIDHIKAPLDIDTRDTADPD